LLVGALRRIANGRAAGHRRLDGPDAEGERKAARALAKTVAGAILPPPLCESRAVISELVDAGVPVVAIASARGSQEICTCASTISARARRSPNT
jgi:LacI family transcriptional regulator